MSATPTANLAGYFAAHGVWGVSEGETLIPLLGYELPDGERGAQRFVLDELADAAEAGQVALESNELGATRAVLVTDAYLEDESGPTDALIVQAVEYVPTRRAVTMAVPYRPAGGEGGFAVLPAQLLAVDGWEDADLQAIGEGFFEGIDSHAEAAPVWQAHQVDPDG